MSQCAAFGHELDALGIWWPRGNGDALRSAAGGWESMAEYLDDMTTALNSGAARMLDDYSGEAANAFRALWIEWSADPGYLPTAAADCRQLCRALVDFGQGVDTADRAITQLIELALTAAAVMSGGAGTPSLLDLDEEWVRWLHEQSRLTCEALIAHAEACGPHLGPGAGQEPHVPDGTVTIDYWVPPRGDHTLGPGLEGADPGDPPAIDQPAVGWVHPGTPIDVGHLGTDPVDFGDGQGDLVLTMPYPTGPSPAVPPIAPPPASDPAPIGGVPGGLPTPGGPWRPGGGSPGDSCEPHEDEPPSSPADPDGPGSSPAGEPVVEIPVAAVGPSGGEPTAEIPVVEIPGGLGPAGEIPDAEMPVAGVDPADVPVPEILEDLLAGAGGGPAPTSVAAAAPAISVPPPMIPAPPPIDAGRLSTMAGVGDLATLGATGQTVAPLASIRPPAAVDASAAAAASGGGGRSGRMPLPMMPMGMGAGGAGDDGDEPRRRRMRHPR